MANINIENYFKESENKYYEPKIVIDILEDILGKPIDEIKKEVEESKINVTKEQIENFLEQKLIEEDPELKKRIESPRQKRSRNILELTKEDIENSAKEFVDDISIGRYRFEPYTLEYFNRYTTIVRKKSTTLLNIIKKIGNKKTWGIKKTLDDLDVVLDKKGKILKSDIIRLITPTVYNVNLLNEKISQANDLSTYLTFKMSKHSLYKNDISEGEIYPSQSIITYSLLYGNLAGNVSLSENQEKKLEKKLERNTEIIVNSLFGE